MLTLDDVYRAANVLLGVVRKTDIIYAPELQKGADIYLKTENLQLTGSFKIRGAYFKIAELSYEEKRKGVIACSAGNHAQGVAFAAQKHNIRSIVCLPSCAPISKINATKGYGAEIYLVDGVYDDAYNKAVSLQREFGYTFVHPFDDEKVIAGQGTVALEILEQLPGVDAIVCPIGGGGLISGVAFVIKTIKPNVKIYGVQADGAASMLSSIASGKITELKQVSTVADGIAVKKPGRMTFDLCSSYVDEIVTVSDGEIFEAIFGLLRGYKLISEGAGAVAVAAAVFDKINLRGKKTVCILSGGNIDPASLSNIINKYKNKEK